jgi:hypothetical protein
MPTRHCCASPTTSCPLRETSGWSSTAT